MNLTFREAVDERELSCILWAVSLDNSLILQEETIISVMGQRMGKMIDVGVTYLI